MPDYKAMYFKLFNRITDAIRILEKAQQESEEAFIRSEDTRIVVLPDMVEDDKE